MVMTLGGVLPPVELTAPDGSKISVSDYLGRPLVLYFYPRDDTSGCTREAQDFSALQVEFGRRDATVLGVSKDSPAKHLKFIEKHGLTITLATDETGAAIDAFGVWIEKRLYGKTYMGIDRSTFLFDASGRLHRVWRRVRVPGHADEVLKSVEDLARQL